MTEVVAASTVQHKLVPIRGFVQEIGIPQVEATPLYVDSQSTGLAANDTGSVKRSVWTLRRVEVLREGVGQRDIAVIHIPEKNNVADGFTKPVAHDVWLRHIDYITNQSA